jgi:glycosyltransferase involved in cell wall biosynthesis
MSDKKRILFIHHGVGIGGAPQSLRLLLLALDKNVYEPTVLFLFDSPAISLFKAIGIKVAGPVLRVEFSHTVIWWYRWYHVHHFLRALWDFFMVLFCDGPGWFRELKPEVVHLNTSSLCAWGLVAWYKKIPVVCHIRESLAPGYLGIRRMIIRFLVGFFSTKIIAISQHDGRFWEGDKRLQILPNPVDCRLFEPNPKNRNKFRKKYDISDNAKALVYLGGLSREKGALLALQLLEELLASGRDVILVIAGSWQIPQSSILRRALGVQSWYEQVEVLVNKHERSIRFVGVVSSAHEILQACDCLLFPAQKGHFARPVLEAGAVAVPVLASRLSPLDELVVDGVTGFLCDPENVFEWKGRCEELFHGRKIDVEYARERVINNYSVPNYSEKINQIFESI